MRLLAPALSALFGLSLSASGFACSICRCGDPIFNALGKDGMSLPGFKLALDWEEVSKSEGSRDGEFSSVLEHRVTRRLESTGGWRATHDINRATTFSGNEGSTSNSERALTNELATRPEVVVIQPPDMRSERIVSPPALPSRSATVVQSVPEEP